MVQYMIRVGDTVQQVSERFRTSVDAIMAMNPDLQRTAGGLIPGDMLTIPGTYLVFPELPATGFQQSDARSTHYTPTSGAEESMMPWHEGVWPGVIHPYGGSFDPRMYRAYETYPYSAAMFQQRTGYVSEEPMESSWVTESDVDSDWGSGVSPQRSRTWPNTAAFDEASDSFASPLMHSMTFESDSMTSASDFSADEESPSR